MESEEWLHGKFLLDPLRDEEFDRFVHFWESISMLFFGKGPENAVLIQNLPEVDDSDGTVVNDKD